ncbi:hypothetical protein [Ammoniphilus sp. 3BR4]|uniref:hypothetical protein n=1 Tax=Ammoniphilus sp. 3BR4 TaxID=3158265 RepID=UPI0034678814
MNSSPTKLNQKVIQDILTEAYEKSQRDQNLDSQEVVNEMVKQLKQAMYHAGREHSLV